MQVLTSGSKSFNGWGMKNKTLTFRICMPNEKLGDTIAVTAKGSSVCYFYQKADESIGLLIKTPKQALLVNEPIHSIEEALQML